MRIQSSFRDYYDGIQSNEYSVVYRRYQSKEKVKLDVDVPDFSKACTELIVVGFCGQLYPGIQFSFSQKTAWQKYDCVCYSLEEVDNLAKTVMSDKEYNYWLKETDLFEKRYGYKVFKEFFLRIHGKLKNLPDFFNLRKVPVFVIEDQNYYDNTFSVILNGELKPKFFFRKFEPYQAFQEIEYWLNNCANPEKEIPKISDSDMICAKGFDKYSFRKSPKSPSKTV